MVTDGNKLQPTVVSASMTHNWMRLWGRCVLSRLDRARGSFFRLMLAGYIKGGLK